MKIKPIYDMAYGKTIGSITPNYENPKFLLNYFKVLRIVEIITLPTFSLLVAYFKFGLLPPTTWLICFILIMVTLIFGMIIASSIIKGIENGLAFIEKEKGGTPPT